MKKNKTVNKSVLDTLSERSNNAISLITNTIKDLKDANEAIDVEHDANVSRIEELRATNNALDNLKNSNDKIITNFETLLS